MVDHSADSIRQIYGAMMLGEARVDTLEEAVRRGHEAIFANNADQIGWQGD